MKVNDLVMTTLAKVIQQYLDLPVCQIQCFLIPFYDLFVFEDQGRREDDLDPTLFQRN